MTASWSPWCQYTRLFAASVLALVAAGIAIVALALLAFDLPADHSCAVLGSALALKMAITVIVPLFAQDLATRIPRKSWIIVICLARGGVHLFLTFVTQPVKAIGMFPAGAVFLANAVWPANVPR